MNLRGDRGLDVQLVFEVMESFKSVLLGHMAILVEFLKTVPDGFDGGRLVVTLEARYHFESVL